MKRIMLDLKNENNFAFGRLYQDNFGKILNFVQNNSGNHADAEDLFQEAMMVLVEKLRQDNFQLTASINTYVYAICKNIWFKKLRNKNYTLSIEELRSTDFLVSIEDSIEDEMTYLEKLKGYLTQVTDHCNRLIHDMVFRGKSLDRIQEKYGYSSAHSVQNQKYKCVQQIRKVKEKEQRTKK